MTLFLDKRDVKTCIEYVLEDTAYLLDEVMYAYQDFEQYHLSDIRSCLGVILTDIKFLFDGTHAGSRRAMERLSSVGGYGSE